MKYLIDAMHQNVYKRLKEMGYDAYSIKGMQREGKKIRSHYSRIEYARKNGMVLISEDKEVIAECQESGIPCIPLGQKPDFEWLISQIQKFENSN